MRTRRDEEDSGAHRLAPFGVGWIILLNCVTVGLFSSIWFNLMHGRLPRVRPDDPSAGKAIGFLFIPFFNLYWFFFTYLRLVTRLNEQRTMRGMPASNLHGLVLAFCIIHLVSTIILMFVFPAGVWINPISMVMGCIVFSVIQGRVNELVEASAIAPVRGEGKTCPRCAEHVKAAATACRFCGHEFIESEAGPQEQDDAALATELWRVLCRHRRKLALTWGWLLTSIGLAFAALTTFYVLGIGVPPPPEGPILPIRIAGALFVTAPFLVPGFICLFRARGYRCELDHQEADLEVIR